MSKTLLLLANGFEVLEASAFIDVLGWNKLEGDGTTDLVSTGFKTSVQSAFSQTFEINQTIDQLNLYEYDALAIPGGFEEFGFYEDAFSSGFSEIIQHFHKKKKPIASICVGALALGKAGILQNKTCTTYNNEVRKNQLLSFGGLISNNDLVECDHIITSTGPSTATEVAFRLLEKLTTTENTQHVRSIMGFPD